jgi:hypothetical protein
MEDQLSPACGCIDVLLEAAKAYALLFKACDGVDQVSERAPQPIQAPHHQGIPGSEVA